MRYLTYADYERDSALWVSRISPMCRSNLQGAGIDLTVGGDGVNLTSGQEVSFDSGDVMEIRPGDFVNIQTAEELTLEDTDFGFVFAKVSLTQKGFTSFGSKIDPGYRGKLLLSFANNGHNIVTIRKGQSICMVSILVSENSSGYSYTPKPQTPQLSRSIVTMSLDAEPEEVEEYNKAFTRGQMQLFKMFRKLNDRFKDVQETVNVNRRDILTGMLTTTVPTIVIGLLVIIITIFAFTVDPDSVATRVQGSADKLPLIMSGIALVVSSLVLGLYIRSRGNRR